MHYNYSLVYKQECHTFSHDKTMSQLVRGKIMSQIIRGKKLCLKLRMAKAVSQVMNGKMCRK